MGENFMRVNANSIGNFAFIFAAFAAHDFYQLMPAPSFHPAYERTNEFTPFLNRDFLWLIVFWALWKYLKVLLARLLELNSSSTPEKLTPRRFRHSRISQAKSAG